MICWAVTGPVGAGKSSFSQALVGLGAGFIDGDALGHQVLEMPAVIQRIVDAFGLGVLHAGAINRSHLGKLVFSDPRALEQLNAITHPHISGLACRKVTSLAKEKRHSLAVFEAAVYFLLPEPPACDLVIAVMASESVRMQRLVSGRQLSLADAKARIYSQKSQEKNWETAGILVNNDGSKDELETEARRLMILHGLIAGD